jgi:hypothetical protein
MEYHSNTRKNALKKMVNCKQLKQSIKITNTIHQAITKEKEKGSDSEDEVKELQSPLSLFPIWLSFFPALQVP